jgi:hypothetical protein
MVLCRMPDEAIPWRTVLRGMAAISRYYGAKNARQAILALSGADDVSDAVIDTPSADRCAEFELWTWDPARTAFVLVRAKTGTPSAKLLP